FAGIGLLISLILIVLHAQRVAALAPERMLIAVAFAQMVGGFLAATIGHGLAHNYSLLRFAEFIVMTGLQAGFALLLFHELLDRAAGKMPAALPLRTLGGSLGELRRIG